MSANLSAELLSKFAQLETARRPFEPVWEVLAALCLPNRTGKFMSGAQRGKFSTAYMDDIYDGTGAQSAEYLTATLLGGLASKTLKWFKLRPDTWNQQIEVSAAELELERRTDFMLEYLARPTTGFYTALAESTLEMVALGTGCLEVYYEPAEGVRFKATSLENIYICTDNHGQVDTVYKLCMPTYKQAAQQWGLENLSDSAKTAAMKTPYETLQVLRCVMPNDAYASGYTDTFKFRSVYIEKESGKVLEDVKLEYFPYIVPRWSKVTDVDYGRSPAWTCKADMEMIQAMEMTALEAAQRAAIPALLTTDDGVIAPIDHQAGGIIPGGLDSLSGRPRIVPLNSGVNPPYLEQFIEQKREAVRRAFFNNQLLMQNRPQMTAEEVNTLREESFRALSPSVLRFIDEVLYPLVIRVYKLLNKHKLFPAVLTQNGAAVFDSYDVQVEFDSPLANTTKMQDFMSFQRYFQQFLLPMAQVDPTVLDTLNFTRTAYMNAFNLNMPLNMLNTPEEADKIKQGRQQAQQADFQMKSQEMQMKANLEQQKIRAMAGNSEETGEL